MNCVIYARVSSREQERDGFSIPAQLRALKKYAIDNNYKIVNEFIDIETAKLSGRTKFGEMVSLLRNNNNIKVLLVEKTDRLYRNLKDRVVIDDLDLELHLVKEHEIISKDSRSQVKFHHDINLVVAKNYLDNLSEEVKKGLLERVREGKFPCRAPLGYKNDMRKRIIEIDPSTSLLVAKLFEWYATGKYSLKEVGLKAYRENVGYSKRGNKLTAGTIQKVLKNPVYIGMIRFKGDLYQGIHESIVTEDLFEEVQKQLGRYNRPKHRRKYFAFRGLLECGYCGCAITAQLQKGRYVYYNCTEWRGKCKQKYYKEEEVAIRLGEAIKSISIDEELVDWIKKALKGNHAEEQEHHKRTKSMLYREQKRLESMMANMYDHLTDGILTTDEYKLRREKTASRIREIEAKLTKLNSANIEYYLTGAKILELAEGAHEQYMKQSNEEKRKLLDFVISKCIVKDGKFIPEFRQPFDLFALYKERERQKVGEKCEKTIDHQLWLAISLLNY